MNRVGLLLVEDGQESLDLIYKQLLFFKDSRNITTKTSFANQNANQVYSRYPISNELIDYLLTLLILKASKMPGKITY